MTGKEAFAVLLREVTRRSQTAIAADIGVSEPTVSRWIRSPLPPRGANLSRLVLWAESLPSQPQPDVLAAAIEKTGANLVRLAEIRGHARAVLSMLKSVTDEQQRVVDSLEPWSRAEGTALAAQVPEADHEAIRESVRQSAAKKARTRRKEA